MVYQLGKELFTCGLRSIAVGRAEVPGVARVNEFGAPGARVLLGLRVLRVRVIVARHQDRAEWQPGPRVGYRRFAQR